MYNNLNKSKRTLIKYVMLLLMIIFLATVVDVKNNIVYMYMYVSVMLLSVY